MKKIIHGLIGFTAGLALGTGVMFYFSNKTVNERDKKVAKFKLYYNLLNQWLINHQNRKSLEEFFLENKYNSVAIYGMGEIGSRLYDELKESSIEVKYAIDKKVNEIYSELEVYSIEDELPEVDAIIISAIFDYDEIQKNLKENTDIPLISLEDIIFEI